MRRLSSSSHDAHVAVARVAEAALEACHRVLHDLGVRARRVAVAAAAAILAPSERALGLELGAQASVHGVYATGIRRFRLEYEAGTGGPSSAAPS